MNYTFTKNDSLFTRISRFAVSADNTNIANEDSEESLLEFYQPFSNHNGGQLEFGPDGYLYISSGDGGSGGDPFNNAQKRTSYLGKLLRIDVGTTPYSIPEDNPFFDVDTLVSEIWAYGLRNPWKFAFDNLTGDLYIGDVGQGALEEVDFQASGSPGGANYGWRCYEGTQPYQLSLCSDTIEVTEPVFEYGHDAGCSITGGRVYRGNSYPNLEGKYILADFCSGNYWLLWQENEEWQSFFGGSLTSQIVAFGEDVNGEMYAVKTSQGIIYKVTEAFSETELEATVSWIEACGSKPAVLELYQPGTDILTHEFDVIINPSGQFLVSEMPFGVFDIFLKVDGYLKKSVGTQTITPNTILNFPTITPGDINGDNVINISDLSQFALSFGKTSGDEGYNSLADLNCDSNVNIVDISLLAGSYFGLEGDFPPLD